MIRSVDRFLITHTGSLPRPRELVDMMFARADGAPVDEAALAARVRDAIAEAVMRQCQPVWFVVPSPAASPAASAGSALSPLMIRRIAARR